MVSKVLCRIAPVLQPVGVTFGSAALQWHFISYLNRDFDALHASQHAGQLGAGPQEKRNIAEILVRPPAMPARVGSQAVQNPIALLEVFLEAVRNLLVTGIRFHFTPGGACVFAHAGILSPE